MTEIARVIIKPGEAVLNGERISSGSLSAIYREVVGGYPKFFKMDSLCKLGFLAAELLLKPLTAEEREHAAVVLFNRNGSLITDRNYQHTITADNYFPSPSLFVYTLANIVTGEIAIRHKIYGETAFHILSHPDEQAMAETVEGVLLTSSPSVILTGWVDYDSEDDYLADMKLIKK